MSAEIDAYRELEPRIRAAFEPGWDAGEFGALALAIHRFQRLYNQPYARFCQARPEPASWQQIPAVPQSAFKHATLTVAPEAVTQIFQTSGTTGEGRGLHHFVDTKLYEGAVIAGWKQLGLPERLQLILTPAATESPNSSLSHMMATLAAFGAQRYVINAEGAFDLPAIREEIQRGEPLALLGTALAFLNLFEALGGERLPLPAGSFAMETGGYKGSGRDIAKPALYAKFEEFLGLPAAQVINEYGMTELSSQFYTRGLDQVHTGPPWLRALIIDPETGNEVPVGGLGVLRIFDLANLGSALALETQDLAMRQEEGFFLLGRDPSALPRGCSRAADELLSRS